MPTIANGSQQRAYETRSQLERSRVEGGTVKGLNGERIRMDR